MSEDLTITYEHVTYGFAGILLPDGNIQMVRFNGTPSEAQRQVNEAAERLGGVAPEIGSPGTMLGPELERLACRILNSGFEAAQEDSLN